MANSKYNRRRWSVPSKRAKGYAEDRKAKVHTYGPKEGKELTDYEAGSAPGICRHSPTMPVCTSTRKPFPRARANRKRGRSRRPEVKSKGG